MESQHRRGKAQQAWAAIVQEWHESGLNQAVFARSKGVNYWTFRKWRKKIEGPEPPSSEVRLVAVETRMEHLALHPTEAAPVRRADLIEIDLPNGLRCTFAAGTDPAYLGELFCALAPGRGRRC